MEPTHLAMQHPLNQGRTASRKLVSITLGVALAVLLSACMGSHAAGADYFDCYEGCTTGHGPLKGSACIENATTGDWHTTCTGLTACPDLGSDVTVLSPHGGKIETHTSAISAALAGLYGWNRYDLSAHLVSGGTCDQLARAAGIPSKLRNHGMLHVTSTHFNHAEALTLVGAHPHAVSIHGCSSSCASSTICIGGANTWQIDTFKHYVDTYKGVLSYALHADKVKSSDTLACRSYLRGSTPSNIVNQTSSGHGGLQLEMSKNVRQKLVSSAVPADLLRGVVYGGVAVAMGEVPLPLTFLDRTQTYTAGGHTFTRYRLRVDNAAAFPPELFAPAPTLPPCDSNPNAARTWVQIYNAGNNQYIYGFCALSAPAQLNSIWFAVQQGNVVPNAVYIKLIDRQTDKTYQSNRVPIP